jgi:hypothetical protein
MGRRSDYKGAREPKFDVVVREYLNRGPDPLKARQRRDAPLSDNR